MGADLPLLAYIVNVVITVEKLIRLPMDEAAFMVVGEGGHRQLRWVDIAAEKLPSLVNERLMRVEIRQQYTQYRFHPYFDLFLRCLDEGTIERLHRLAAELPTRTENESPARAKLRLAHLRDSCAELNACARRIQIHGQEQVLRDQVKNFRRVAHERRKGLTQLLLKVLDKVHAPRIMSLQLHGSYATYTEKVSHAQITQYRKALIRYFQERLPEQTYRGYAVLLKHSARWGYYLEALVFFRDNWMQPVEAIAERIRQYWVNKITVGRGRCTFYALQDEGRFESPAHYFDALVTATRLTEVDFYVQIEHEKSQDPTKPKSRNRVYWASRKFNRKKKRNKVARSTEAALNRLKARKRMDPLLREAQARHREKEMRLRELPRLPADRRPLPLRGWEKPLPDTSDPPQEHGRPLDENALLRHVGSGDISSRSETSRRESDERETTPAANKPAKNPTRPVMVEVKGKRTIVKRKDN